MNTKKMTINALLAAMCAVLGYVSLDLGYLKVTFESVPVLMAGLMFGPGSGALVGGIGTLIYQLLRYGVSATTLLWMLPYILSGFISGLFAKKYGFRNTTIQLAFIISSMEILVFLLNTAVIYIDSKLYGYYSFAYVFGSFFVRFAIAIVKCAAFSVVIPRLLIAMSGITGNGRRG